MKNLFCLLIVLLSLKSFAQAGPPPVAYPTEENKILIDRLTETAGLKKYIYNYCTNRINLVSRLEKWDENKKNEIIKSIHLEKMDDAIYNSFSNYTKEELETLIESFSKLRSNKKSDIIPMPLILQVRMEGFSKSLIKGDYLYLNEKK
ncbi:hypothetical protein PYS58_12515 [Chryseobacterium indologenes]|uniref:hypothetical protein n=1 Tax=Chryseobacterium indologenes TaxID=253 RepID=UPI0023E8C0A3|nr:hypothetical protein [Chryseobacterium indologenes]WET47409.1 hypothetical protein PYS58_12515 [Chryseobacterium indologenes]